MYEPMMAVLFPAPREAIVPVFTRAMVVVIALSAIWKILGKLVAVLTPVALVTDDDSETL